MFEHSLYEPKPEPAPHETAHPTSQEGDLFHRYEIKNWDLSPRLFKILGIAALVNVLLIVVVGQGAFLTMKGCDSPLVGGVCQVLDTVYVSAMIYGTESEYVDEPYDQTDLENAEVTFVDVSGVEEPMAYPTSYVDATTGETVPMFPQPTPPPEMAYNTQEYVAPGIPATTPSTGKSLIDTPQTLPKQNNNILDGTLPNGFGGINSNPTLRKGGRGGRVKPPLADEDDTAKAGDEKKPADTNPTVEPTAPVDANVINTRPLIDLSGYVNDLLDKNQYRLDSQFYLSAKGKLNKDGKFERFKTDKAESPDKKTIDVLLKAIAALGDSGQLKVLSDISGRDLSLVISQDAANLNAVVESEMENPMRANSVKANLDLAISIAKAAKAGENADQNDKDDLLLLQNVKVEVNGKKVILTFLSPKELFLPMIQRKLAEQKAAPKPQNGNSVGNSASNRAQK